MNNKILFILDLDHTLIYGSYAQTEPAEFLFQHNKYLKVYKRNLAEDLLRLCRDKGDIIVYTTALRGYAKTICKRLEINPTELLSRKYCKVKNGNHKKLIKQEWLEQYEKIIIIDDSPNVWLTENEKVDFLVPMEFRGEKEDMGLVKIIEQIEIL